MVSLFDGEIAAYLLLVVFRVTLLLAVTWFLYLVLAGSNPRWRVSLWRATLLGVVAIFLLSALVPGWGPGFARHPVARFLESPADGAFLAIPQASRPKRAHISGDREATSAGTADRSGVAKRDTARTNGGLFGARNPTAIGRLFRVTLQTGYVVVASLLAFRLLAQCFLLGVMLREAESADDRVTRLLLTAARETGLTRKPRVVVSASTPVPLVTGVFRPVVVLPLGLSQRLTDQQLQFVLAHECVHIAGYDLPWALAVRCVRILLWPHPLVWQIPAAHRYACDVRCDALASRHDAVGYSSMLAQLSLSLHQRSDHPLAMAFLRGPEVVRRLRRIETGADADPPSDRRRMLAGLGMMVVLLAIGTFGVSVVPLRQAFADDRAEEVNVVELTVIDANGDPVEAADVHVRGLRTRKDQASAYLNHLQTRTSTNKKGVADLVFPMYVYEEMETGSIMVTIAHPEYVHYSMEHSVDSPIKAALQPGRRIQLTAIDGRTGERINDRLFAMLPGNVLPGNWESLDDGSLRSGTLDPGLRSLRLVCQNDSEPTLFSDLIDLKRFPAGDCQIKDVALHRGARFSGKLSDHVPRPVINGTVGMFVSSTVVSENPSYDNSLGWYDFAVISADGTFEFTSVPRDSTIQLVVNCDGWVSVAASPPDIVKRFPYIASIAQAQSMHDTMVIAQTFAAADRQPIEVKMEPASACRFTIVDDRGLPVPDATISMSPNLAWSPGPGGIVGHYSRTAATLGLPAEESEQLAREEYGTSAIMKWAAVTDADGKAVIKDLPGKRVSISIQHADYELPSTARNPNLRHEMVQLTLGQTSEVHLTLQRRGREVLGR